jgi:lysozyme family protein
MADFSTILPIVLVWEGTTYTDDPADNGGATRYGITQGTLSNYLGRQASKDEVRNLKMDVVQAIYRKKYWDVINGDKLGNGLSLMLLDAAINHGTSKAIQFLQQALKITIDGGFGPKTLQAVNDAPSQYNLILSISNLRRARYQSLDDFPRFGKGWLNRLNDITNKALAYENKYVVKKPEVVIPADPVPATAPVPAAPVSNSVPNIPDVDSTLSNETIQKLLTSQSLYSGAIDGLIGPKTMSSINLLLAQEVGGQTAAWSNDRKKVAVGQVFAKKNNIEVGTVDGLVGPQTRQAFKELNYLVLTGKELPKWRDVITKPDVISKEAVNDWPLQKDVEKFYGKVGENQATLITPYKMKLAWDTSTVVSKFSCHEKVHDSLARIFQKTLDEYGEAKIADLKLDYFGGCLNIRKMRGGSSWSMHSWGIAVDLDPERNQLEMHKDVATFAKADYVPFWRIVESEGWVSLGRSRDYDWMHFQAARL